MGANYQCAAAIFRNCQQVFLLLAEPASAHKRFAKTIINNYAYVL
jgi:hypothetical protein